MGLQAAGSRVGLHTGSHGAACGRLRRSPNPNAMVRGGELTLALLGCAPIERRNEASVRGGELTLGVPNAHRDPNPNPNHLLRRDLARLDGGRVHGEHIVAW